jgi:outer membrane protein assembly factor BamB
MKSIISILLISMSVIVCSGQSRFTWPMIGGDPAHSSYAQINLDFPLEVTRSLHIGYDNESGIAVSEDQIFVADYAQDSNRLWATDLGTGMVQWSFPVPNTGGGMAFIPAVAEGVVLVGGQGGPGLYALDAMSGDSLWLLPVGSLYTRVPVISEGRVYQISLDSLSCVDLHTGEIYWSFVESMPQISPAADAERVYFASRAHMYAVDKITGDTSWVSDSVTVGDFMSIAVDMQYVFTGNRREVAALSKTTGEVVWKKDLSQNELLVDWPGAYALTDEYLVIKHMDDDSSGNHYLVVDRNTGAEVSRFVGSGSFTYGSPTVVNNYVVDYGFGQLQFIDISTGALMYEMNGLSVGGYPTQLVAADDRIFISGDGPDVLILEKMSSAVHPVFSAFRLSLFPNPAIDQTCLRFYLDKGSDLALSIISPEGMCLYTEDLGFFPSGDHQVAVGIAQLPPGIYAIHLQGDKGFAAQRLIKTE